MRLLLTLSFLLAVVVPARAEIRPTFLMYGDPQVVVPDPIAKFSPRLVPLWLEALEHPEGDLQRTVCEAIARGRREIILTGHGKLAVFLQRHFPWALSLFFRMTGYRGRREPKATT